MEEPRPDGDETTRDVDYAVWINPENLLKLKSALE